MEKKIDSFRGQYSFLSNFSTCKIRYNGLLFCSTEAAFQAQKCANDEDRISFQFMTASESKQAGKAVTLRADWNLVKDSVMYDLIKIKFLCEPFKSKLIATGDIYIEEGNYWHDNYWGNCYCNRCVSDVGKNRLGKILMKVRSEL